MIRVPILIVAYQFYPRGGVGTRRWSKFVKYLSTDHEVHVLSAKYPYEDKVNFGHYDIFDIITLK